MVILGHFMIVTELLPKGDLDSLLSNKKIQVRETLIISSSSLQILSFLPNLYLLF